MPAPASPAPVLKSCTNCLQPKPVSEFNRHKRYADGYRYQCRSCQSTQAKEYRDRLNADNPEWRRAKKYKLRYGLSLEALDEILRKADYRCQSCGTHRDNLGKNKLVLDHDHSCCPTEYTCGSCIRGILCTKCNVAFGALGDSLERVELLANYARSVECRNLHSQQQ